MKILSLADDVRLHEKEMTEMMECVLGVFGGAACLVFLDGLALYVLKEIKPGELFYEAGSPIYYWREHMRNVAIVGAIFGLIAAFFISNT